MDGILVKGKDIFGLFNKFCIVESKSLDVLDTKDYGWDLCAIDDLKHVYKLANYSTENRARIELDMVFSAMLSEMKTYSLNLEDNSIQEECFYDVIDGLSVRTINCVRRMGIRTLAELLEKKQIDFFKTRNLGRKSFKELMIAIKKNGFTLQKHPADMWDFNKNSWIVGEVL